MFLYVDETSKIGNGIFREYRKWNFLIEYIFLEKSMNNKFVKRMY